MREEQKKQIPRSARGSARNDTWGTFIFIGEPKAHVTLLESQERMREVLYRWAFDEPWDEISGDMGVTANALKKRLAYHLKKIRSRMLNASRPVNAKG